MFILPAWRTTRKNMKVSRRFTLIELILVMSLIALTFAVVGSLLPRSFTQDKVEADIARYHQTLELAETIMATKEVDVQLACDQTKEGVVCTMRHSHGLQTFTLKHLTHLTYNALPTPFTLQFRAKHLTPPVGEIEIGTAKHKRYILLPGYIGGNRVYHTKPFIGERDGAHYPEEILSVA